VRQRSEWCFPDQMDAVRGKKPVSTQLKPVSNPYRTDFMDLRIHDMDYGFTIWIYGSTDFMDFE
jgi:hypothetical protein